MRFRGRFTELTALSLLLLPLVSSQAVCARADEPRSNALQHNAGALPNFARGAARRLDFSRQDRLSNGNARAQFRSSLGLLKNDADRHNSAERFAGRSGEIAGVFEYSNATASNRSTTGKQSRESQVLMQRADSSDRSARIAPREQQFNRQLSGHFRASANRHSAAKVDPGSGLSGLITDPTCGCTGGADHPPDITPESRRLARQLDLDLRSGEKSISLSSKLFKNQSSVTLQLGNSTKTYEVGAYVTAAEYVAIVQALKSDGQSLLLDESGAAHGGQLSLDFLKQGNIFRNLTELVIPEHVQAFDDIARGALRISGDLVNYGQILGIVDQSGRDGIVMADGIINHSGAIIAMAPPDCSPGNVEGLAQLPVMEGTQLSVTASRKLFNAGTIFSVGNLLVNATELKNRGSLISSGALTINAGNVTNSGLIQSLGAALQLVSNSLSGELNVENSGGKISSCQEMLVAASGPVNVVGGLLDAPKVTFHTPYSVASVAADAITGLVDVVAFSSAVHVNSGDLSVNNIKVVDDPIFTNSTGNIILPKSIVSSSGPVTAVAAGDIVGHADGTVIDTSSEDENGGDVILLAGVNNVTTNGTTTVSGPSALGGSVSGITSIDASSDDANGGDVIIGAFNGSVSVFGPIIADGKSGGVVKIFSPGSISLGDVTSKGNHNNDSLVSIRTVNPLLGSGLTFNSTGTLLSGTVNASSQVGSGSITTGDLESGVRNYSGASAADIDLLAGGSITTDSIRAMGGGGGPKGFRLQGWDYSSNGGNGGAVTVVAQGGDVKINGDVNTSGGGGGGSNWTIGGKGGDGGAVLITALSDVVIDGPVLSPGGGGGGGVGISSTDTAGGGGSLGNGGGPNSGGIFFAPPPYDGPAYLDNGLNPHNPNHPRFPYAGMGGTNTAYDIGCCGSGYGGDVGDYGENGDQGTFAPRGWWNDTSPKIGGAPGLAGDITLKGRDIAITKTIASYYTKTDIEKSPYAAYSVFTHSQRGGGEITITTASGNVTSTEYSSNSDLESSTPTIAAQLRPGQLTLGGSMRGEQVSINNTALNDTTGPGIITSSGTGSLTLSENGSNKVITNGTMVTPAEWVALVNKAVTGSQGLQLTGSGVANGGSFGISSDNLPLNGFFSLVVPNNVSASVKQATLNAALTNIKGELRFETDATLNTSNLSVSGVITAPSSSLSIRTPQITLNSGSRISGETVGINSSSALTFNLTSGANPAVIESTIGQTVIESAGQAITINSSGGGTATLNLSGQSARFAASTFTNSANVTLSATSDLDFLLSGGQFQNQGSIKVADSVGNGGDFDLQSTATNFSASLGNVNVGPTAPGGGHGGTLSVSVINGVLNLIAPILDVSASGTGAFDGGDLSLVARALTIGGGSLGIVANGSGTGSGGAVNIQLTGSGSDLTVGNGSGQLGVTANGGNSGGAGGALSVSAGRNVTIDSGHLDLGPRGNGAGAQIDVMAGTAGSGNVLITGPLNVNGIGNGNGGTLHVRSNSNSAFIIGTPTGNGVAGALSANAGSSGSGGFLSIENAGNGGIQIDSSTLVSAQAGSGDGGRLSLSSLLGKVSLAAGLYAFSGSGAQGDGGAISVAAKQLALGGGGVQLNANASGQGDGGAISVDVRDTQKLTLDGSTLKLTASGGSSGSNSGKGGTIQVANGGDLTVETGSVLAAPLGNTGAGASYALTAGTLGSGSLLIKDSLNAAAKGNTVGGDITLKYASVSDFVIGGSGFNNGVVGSVLANGSTVGGDITIENTSSSVQNVSVNSNLSATGSAPGTITFRSLADIQVVVSGSLSGTVSAFGGGIDLLIQSGALNVGTLQAGLDGVAASAAGAVTISGPVTTSGDVNFNAQGNILIDGSVSGSVVSFTSQSQSGSGVTIADQIYGTAVAIETEGSAPITFVNGDVTATHVDLKTGSGSISSSTSGASITAGDLRIESSGGSIGTSGQPFRTNVASLAVSTGGAGEVVMENLATNTLDLLDSSSGGKFNLQAHGSVTINDLQTSAGDILVQTSSGKLYVRPNANILAVDGDVNLRNDNFETGEIALGANSTIKGSSLTPGLGDVYIGFGPQPQELAKPKKRWKNVVMLPTNGGSVHLSKGGLRAAEPTNTLIADGRKIVFQNLSSKKKRAIELEGNVTVIADPPVAQAGAVSLLTGMAFKGSETNAGLSRYSSATGGITTPTIVQALPKISVLSLNNKDFAKGSSVQTIFDRTLNQAIVANGFSSKGDSMPSLSDGAFSLPVMETPSVATNNSLNQALVSNIIADNCASVLFSLDDNSTSNPVLQATVEPSLDRRSAGTLKWNGSVQENIDVSQAASEIEFWSHDLQIGEKTDAVRIVDSESSRIYLDAGAVLFAPAKDTSVTLPKMTLRIAAHSLALVLVSDSGVSVYDLDDRKKGAIVLSIDEDSISLSPGHHVTVVDTAGIFDQVNPLEAIPHRALKVRKHDGWHIHTSEFSLPAAIENIQLLQQLLRSPADKAVRRRANLVKTAAVIMQLRGSDSFQFYGQAPMTAYSR